jgi:hypothetical protein
MLTPSPEIIQLLTTLVAYLSHADNVSRLLPNPLSEVNQSVTRP